jgi:outer membrane protein assembly factor BamB
MKFTHTQRKQTASFRMTGLMLAIAPLWLMLAAANTSAYAQTSDNVSNSTAATTNPSLADWTQFHRDNMQRWNPYETVLGINNVGSLQLKWKATLGGEAPFSRQSSAAVVNGVVYVTAGVSSSPPGKLYALNASTGATLWSFATDAGVTSPAVANGIVYVDGHDNDAERVYALNASTGATLWSYSTGSLAARDAPAVANGVVYITTAGFNSEGHPITTLYALNASTGADGGTSPAVANGVVYFGSTKFNGFSLPFNTSNIYALNASTGVKLWSYTIEDEVLSSPAVANGVVYIGIEAGYLYALNASTGALLWSYETADAVESTAAIANGVVYFSTVGYALYALNASTGARLWSYSQGVQEFSSLAVANGVAYFNSFDGNLYALDAHTGTQLWSYPIGASEDNSGFFSPVVVNGVVYISAGDMSGNENVYAFSVGADLFLRIRPTLTTVHQGDLLTYAFPVWNLGPKNADQEVLNTPYLGSGPIPIVCHENSVMDLNTTWTVRLTVKVTAPAGTVITENAATMADTPDPNMANNTATVSLTVVP